jgi:hypothetical protein
MHMVIRIKDIMSPLFYARIYFVTVAASVVFCSATPPPHHEEQKTIIEYTVLWGPKSQPIFKQCSRPVPAVKGLFTPTSMQVDTLFGDLAKKRKDLEKKLSLPLEKYYYQAVGFNDSLVYLNSIAMQEYRGIPDWRAVPIVACKHGALYWGIVYNIQTRIFDRFFTNSK